MGQAFSARTPGQDGQLVEIGSKSAFKDINRQLYSQSEFDLDTYSPPVARPEKLTEEIDQGVLSFGNEDTSSSYDEEEYDTSSYDEEEYDAEEEEEEEEEEDSGWGFGR